MPAQTSGTTVKFYAKNDTAPPVQDVLLDRDGEIIDLTSASTVTLSLVSENTEVEVNDSACTVVSAAAGSVKWTPPAGTFSYVGRYRYQYEITWADGTVQTSPSTKYYQLVVRTSLSELTGG